jgi:hypothetical protein
MNRLIVRHLRRVSHLAMQIRSVIRLGGEHRLAE